MIDDVLDYIQTLPITQGDNRGEGFKVLDWQADFIRGALAEGVRTAALSLARNNGKSVLVAALACAHLCGPAATKRGQILCVASSFAQAKIVFGHVLAFLADEMAENPRDWHIVDNMARASILHKPTGSELRAIASDPRRMHGLAPSLILADEPAQWETNKSNKALAALVTGMGKQPDARMIAIGTRPADPQHWFQKWLDGGADFRLMYAAPERLKPFGMAALKRANPSWEHLPSLRANALGEMRKAKKDPAALPSYRALILNQGVADTLRNSLLDPAVWRKHCETDELPERVGQPVWGIDLGSGYSMSAISAYWSESGRLETMAALPSDPDLEARGRRDGVGGEYQRMHERGELLVLGRRIVPIPELLDIALERFGQPRMVVADSWREKELQDALDMAGVPATQWESRRQGFYSQGEDVRELRKAVLEDAVKTAPSLLLTSALREAVCKMDDAANEKLSKSASEGARSGGKSDAAVATLLAVSAGRRHPSAVEEKVYWSVA